MQCKSFLNSKSYSHHSVLLPGHEIVPLATSKFLWISGHAVVGTRWFAIFVRSAVILEDGLDNLFALNRAL